MSAQDQVAKVFQALAEEEMEKRAKVLAPTHSGRQRPIYVEKDDGTVEVVSHADLVSGLMRNEGVAAEVVRPRSDGRCHRCGVQLSASTKLKTGLCSGCYNMPRADSRFCVDCGVDRGHKVKIGRCLPCHRRMEADRRREREERQPRCECGAKLSVGSKTGMCARCLQEAAARRLEAERSRPRRKRGRKVGGSNATRWTEEHQRRAMRLRDEGLSHHDIGAALGCSQQVVWYHLRKASS